MYSLNLLIAIDQLCNVILGGMPDETISARAWRNKANPLYAVLVRIIDSIFWFDPKHCETSFESEVIRRYLPEIYSKYYNDYKNTQAQ